MSNICRGPSMDAFYHVSVHLVQFGFRGEKKSTQKKKDPLPFDWLV